MFFQKKTDNIPNVTREEVIKKIKEIIIPELRTQGFKGSYPHFRRQNAENGFDLLSFQFNKYGGSFLVEISVAYPYREEYKNCYLAGNEPLETEIKKVNHGNTFVRHRVKNIKDEWFDFTKEELQTLIERCRVSVIKDMNWFDNPQIYKELETRKKQGLKY